MPSHTLFLLAATITAISADDDVLGYALEFHHPRHHKHHGSLSELSGPQGLGKLHHYGPHPHKHHGPHSEVLGPHGLEEHHHNGPQPLGFQVPHPLVPGSILQPQWLLDEEDDADPRTPWLDDENQEKFVNILRIHGDTIVNSTALEEEKKTDVSKKWEPSQAGQGEDFILY
ncbi:unnamed protein product [Cylicocyclus nassatus]|uniref:Uncharacterized protein n=1 Tax=Cylicocyclus nassatus TaxID=53992 RepID=A0AA36HBW9_CYLNA|nr:unnamed protein product [Cylicocyclus nassatus]